MDFQRVSVRTGNDEVVQDITAQCEKFVSGRGDGLLHVFCLLYTSDAADE